MDKYAVIGNPIEHSLSPTIHTEFARQTKQTLQYIKIQAPLNQFQQTVINFRDQNQGKGANVTLPFKEQAYRMAHNHSRLAQQAKSANTLLFSDSQTIYADCTDGVGLAQDLTHNHHYSISEKSILIIGAGGAARAIIGPLLELAPARLIIANRTREKGILLANEFKSLGEISAIGFDQFEEPYDLIINATSAGLTGSPLELPSSIVNHSSWCYDLMYGQTTPFLNWAKSLNPAKCLDGLGMLVEQAAASFYLWRNVYPDTKPVIEMLEKKRR